MWWRRLEVRERCARKLTRREKLAMLLLVRRVSISALAVLLYASCAFAEETAFINQCTKLLPDANEFASVCLDHARPFSRTFYPGGGSKGEIEAYSTYFKRLEAPSHFLLGCVLDSNRKLSFLGLYYAAEPSDMARFEDYEVLFVDPNDNVGISVNGVQRTLIAIRQFVTDIVPPRLKGRPKNCELPQIETVGGVTATAHDRFRQINQNEFEFCNGVACRSARYSTFVREHRSPLVYASHDVFLIDENGALLIKNEHIDRICSAVRSDVASMYNIVFEMCHQQRR